MEEDMDPADWVFGNDDDKPLELGHADLQHFLDDLKEARDLVLRLPTFVTVYLPDHRNPILEKAQTLLIRGAYDDRVTRSEVSRTTSQLQQLVDVCTPCGPWPSEWPQSTASVTRNPPVAKECPLFGFLQKGNLCTSKIGEGKKVTYVGLPPRLFSPPNPKSGNWQCAHCGHLLNRTPKKGFGDLECTRCKRPMTKFWKCTGMECERLGIVNVLGHENVCHRCGKRGIELENYSPDGHVGEDNIRVVDENHPSGLAGVKITHLADTSEDVSKHTIIYNG